MHLFNHISAERPCSDEQPSSSEWPDKPERSRGFSREDGGSRGGSQGQRRRERLGDRQQELRFVHPRQLRAHVIARPSRNDQEHFTDHI